jgi:hypothetical protein
MSTIFVDNEKSKTIISEENFTTFVSEEKSTGMYFLLNYRYNFHFFLKIDFWSKIAVVR